MRELAGEAMVVTSVVEVKLTLGISSPPLVAPSAAISSTDEASGLLPVELMPTLPCENASTTLIITNAEAISKLKVIKVKVRRKTVNGVVGGLEDCFAFGSQ